MLWVLIRITLAIKTYFVGAHSNRLGEVILMSTHNIGFYEDLTKIIFQLSSNFIKYAPYLFFYVVNVIYMELKKLE